MKKNCFKMCKCITESKYLNALTQYYCIVTLTETDKIHDIISLHVPTPSARPLRRIGCNGNPITPRLYTRIIRPVQV